MTVLNLQGIQFLMTLSQIKRFKNLNVSINVLHHREKTKFFRYNLSIEKGANTLLHMQDPCNDNIICFA